MNAFGNLHKLNERNGKRDHTKIAHNVIETKEKVIGDCAGATIVIHIDLMLNRLVMPYGLDGEHMPLYGYTTSNGNK